MRLGRLPIETEKPFTLGEYDPVQCHAVFDVRRITIELSSLADNYGGTWFAGVTSACLLHSSAPKNTRTLWRSYSTFGYLVSELAIESYRAPHRVLNAIFSHRTMTFLVL
jgi:hypothetical protein